MSHSVNAPIGCGRHGAATPSATFKVHVRTCPSLLTLMWLVLKLTLQSFPKAADLTLGPKPQGINEMYSACTV